MDSYDDCEELFVSVGKAYITVVLMIFFKMESIDDYPTAYCFENNMIHKACETRKQFFDDKIGEFVDNYIFQSNQRPPLWCGRRFYEKLCTLLQLSFSISHAINWYH